jgi:hypothetical protein
MTARIGRKDILHALQTLDTLGMQKSSDWPARLSGELQALEVAGVVTRLVPPGKRAPHIMVIDRARLTSRIAAIAGDAPDENASVRSMNLHHTGDTKLGKKLPYLTLNIRRSGQTVWHSPSGRLLAPTGDDEGAYLGILINEDSLDNYEPLGPVVLVENKDVWVNIANKLPPALQQAALIHYEGWLSERFLQRLASWRGATLHLLADYDPVGYQNFIKLQALRADAQMLVPNLSPAQVEQWGNGQVWKNSLGLVYTVHQWSAQQHTSATRFFELIAAKGLAVEQEALLGIDNLSWQPLVDSPHAVTSGTSSHSGLTPPD